MFSSNTLRGEIAHIALIPNTTEARQEWAYLGVMLEDGFRMAKGRISMTLTQTDVSYIYDVVITTKGDVFGVFDTQGAGVAFLLEENVLDMIRVRGQRLPPKS